MNILMDFQILVLQKYGGISRYTYNLIQELNRKENMHVYIPVLISQNEYFRNHILGYTSKKSFSLFQKRMAKAINILYTFFFVLFHKIDIYHPTYYDPYLIFLCKLKKIKIVISVHDMIHELFNLEKSEKIIKRKEKCISCADAIIAVSENTKKDILKIYPNTKKNKILTIYEGGLDEISVKEVKELPKAYILYVGGRKEYKNFKNFFLSVSCVLKKEDVALVCVGNSFEQEEKEMILEMESEKNVFQLSCSDAELNYLYRNAICFVYPSLYEGFGIPLIEAFGNGCPVLCSKTSCFPEICGDAAVFFDPYNRENMRNEVENIINNPTLRMEYGAKGKNRYQFFSWHKMGEEISGLYKNLANGRNEINAE